MLSIKNLQKTYEGNNRFHLHDVSFDMDEHEVLAIIGENGSGKSTLLNMISGYLIPDSGEMKIDGRPVSNQSNALLKGDREISLVNNTALLKSSFTLWELMIRAYPEYIEDSEIEEIVDWYMNTFEVEDLKDQIPRSLSSGQLQRFSLAYALIKQPKLLLLDESFSHTDAIQLEKLKRSLFNYFEEHQLAMIVVTHNADFARAIGDTIMVFKNGTIHQYGPCEQIAANPKDEFVANLFGPIVRIKEGRKTSFYRPWDLKIDSKGAYKGKVLQIQNHGFYSEYLLKHKRSQIQLFSTGKPLKVGEEVTFSVSTDEALTFGEK